MRAMRHMMAALALLALASCTHKDLCYHHPHTAKVRVDSDWSKFDRETPTGMTVMVYPEEGGAPYRHLTNTITHAYVHLPAGRYSTVVFNQSETEFGSLLFRGMDGYGTAEVYTNVTKSNWYKTKADEERLAAEPEWVGTDRHEGAVVTQAMVDGTGEYNLQQMHQMQSRAPGADYVIAGHTPRNIIYTLNITVHVKGFQNLRSARASMTGLAEGYYLGRGRYTESVVTQLLESWSAEADGTDPTRGVIRTSMTCFGLPDGHTGTAEENIFGISILLVDNKTVKDFTFKVGDDFRRDASAEVELSLNLDLELWIDEPLPDVLPDGGSSSGFDAKVEDWGEEENYEIGI